MMPFPNLPSVNELLDSPAVRGLVHHMNPTRVVSTVRTVLDEVRREMQTAATERAMPNISQLAERIAARVSVTTTGPARPVVNGTGDIFGEHLGGPPLSAVAREALTLAARDYVVPGDENGDDERISALLREIADSEAAMAVSHRAAGCMLALASVGRAKQVIVARGHCVELGSGYRVPEVIESSGAALREVGTVNRTELRDYEAAIGPETGAIFTLQTSSTETSQRPEAVSLDDLSNLARAKKIPLVCDGGDASPVDLTDFGLPMIRSMAHLARGGADLLLVGTRLVMGADPSGLILGSRARLEAIRNLPMTPWFRIGDLPRRALEATLSVCGDPARTLHEIPLLQLLTTSVENLRHRAGRIVALLKVLEGIAEAKVEETTTSLGNEWARPTVRIRIRSTLGPPAVVAARLRGGDPALVCLVDGDGLVIDLRSVLPRQDRFIVDAFDALRDREEEPYGETDREIDPPSEPDPTEEGPRAVPPEAS